MPHRNPIGPTQSPKTTFNAPILGYKLALPSSAMNTYWLRLYEEKISFLLIRSGTIKTGYAEKRRKEEQKVGSRLEVGH
jgi:hypothetical protein